MADDAMMAKPSMTHMATMVCRPAAAGEKANAMAGTEALMCKPIDMPAMKEMKTKLDAMPGGEPLWLKMLSELQIGGPTNN